MTTRKPEGDGSRPESDLSGGEHARSAQVAQANANQSLEGLRPDAHDLALQQKFIKGEIGIQDLLQAAHEFASTHGKNRKS